MLVEHAADANAGTGDSVHESKGIAYDHEFARTTDLPGPTDCRIRFESEGAPPNLSHNPVGSDLAEIGVESLDSQQVAAGARGPLKPFSCRHVWRVALLRRRKPRWCSANPRSFPTGTRREQPFRASRGNRGAPRSPDARATRARRAFWLRLSQDVLEALWATRWYPAW